MNILILPSWYRNKENPTLGSFFREQAIALAKKNHNVTLIFCNTFLYKNNNTYDKKIERYNDNGVNTIIINKGFPFRGLGLLTYISTIVSMIIKYKRYNKINVIHAHSFRAGFVAAICKKLLKLPYIITEHHTKFSRKTLSLKDKIMASMAFKNAKKVIAVSEGLRDDLHKYYKGEILVINNMVDDIFFKGELGNNNAIFTFFTCAYLTYKKGIDILLQSMSILKSKNINCKLIIGGDGEERESLKTMTKRLGLTDRVEFKGSLNRDEVVYYLTLCDAFVLPSRHETFGIVYIEALAMGRPIIMTDTDAANTIANERNGLVVPKESKEELAEAMIKMIHNIDKYDRLAIRKSCQDKFSEEIIVKQLSKLYHNVVN